MEELSTELVQNTLLLISSPDKTKREGAEAFFAKHNQNPSLFFNLFLASVNPGLPDTVRLPACLVLEASIKTIEKNNSALLEMCHQNCLDTLARSPSKAISKTLCSGLYHYLQQVNQLSQASKDPAELQVPVYSQFFERLESETDLSRLYYLLLGYMKISKVFEAFLSTEHKMQLHEKLFARLEDYLVKLDGEACASVRPQFYRVIAKIFSLSFRFSPECYLQNPAKLEFWMKFFHKLLTEFKIYLEAAGQATRFLSSMFRAAMWELENQSKKTKKKKKAAEDQNKAEFFVSWIKTYGVSLCELFYPMIQSFSSSENANAQKVFYNITRAFYCILRIDFLAEAASQKMLALADNLIGQAVMLQKDVEEFSDNPREYFARNNFCMEETNIRTSAVSILTNLLGTSVATQLIAHLILRAQQNKTNLLLVEAIYFLLEKGVKNYFRAAKEHSKLFDFLRSDVVASLQSPTGFLLCRATLLLKSVREAIELPEDLTMLVATHTWQNMQSKDMPTRNFSVNLLNILLENDKVREIVKPNLPSLIRIALDSLKEHWHERIVINLNEILEYFPQEAAPFMIEMLEQLIALAVKLLKSDEESEDNNVEEEKSMSIYSVFEAISTCIALQTSPEVFAQTMARLNPFLQETLKLSNFDSDEHVFQLIAQLVKISPAGSLHPGLWPYFEYFVLSLGPKGHKESPSNPLLALLDEDSESSLELANYSIEALTNFCVKDPQGVLSRSSHLGIPYTTLLLAFHTEILASETDIHEDNQKLRNMLFLPRLLYVFRDHIEPALKDWVAICLAETISFSVEDKINFDHIFIHNAGVLFLAAPQQTLTLVQEKGQAASLISSWVKRHRPASSFEMRKASFLGLLSILIKRKQFASLFEHFNFQDLALFLLTDLVFLDLQKKVEENEEDFPNSDDEDADDDQFKNVEELDRYIELDCEQIDSFLKYVNDQNMFANEQLTGHTNNFIDPIQELDHIAAFKTLLADLNAEDPALLSQLYAKLSQSLQEKIKTIIL